MKRILSLVLAMVMVLGSFSAVFAVEPTVEETAGAFLKAEGVLEGNDSGDLMLGKGLKRQDTVILLSRLMGQYDIASEFPTSEDSPSYNDIKDDNYLPFLAWAEANKTFEGKGNSKFGFNDMMTAQQYAKVLLTVLGYESEVDFEYKDALAKAVELGLMADVEAEDTDEITRGQMAVMSFNALGVTMKDSEKTLAETLEIVMPAPEAPAALEVVSVTADNLKEVYVTFNGAVDADTVTDANIQVKDNKGSVALAADGTTAVITLNVALTNQKEYTLLVEKVKNVNEVEIVKTEMKFKAFDATLPKALSVEVTGPRNLTVTFSEPIKTAGTIEVKQDKATLGNTVSISGNKANVTVFTNFVEGKEYTVSVNGFKDHADYPNVLNTLNFTYEKDATPPVATVEKVEQTYVVVSFNKPVKGLTKNSFYHTFSAWNAVNVYKDAAKTALNSSDSVDKVYVYFYEASGDKAIPAGATLFGILGKDIKDNWGNAVGNQEFTISATADRTTPEVKEIKVVAENQLNVTFTKDVTFSASNVEILDEAGKNISGLYLTVAAVKANEYTITMSKSLAGKTVTVSIKNVKDTSLYQNILSLYTQTVEITDKSKPVVSNVFYKLDPTQSPAVVGDTYNKAREIYVQFNEAVDAETALVASNYALVYADDTVVILTQAPSFDAINSRVKILLTKEQANTLGAAVGTAKLQVINVKDIAGNAILPVLKSFAPVSNTSTVTYTLEATGRKQVVAKFSDLLSNVDPAKFSFTVGGSVYSNFTLTQSDTTKTTLTFDLPVEMPTGVGAVSLVIAAGHAIENSYGNVATLSQTGTIADKVKPEIAVNASDDYVVSATGRTVTITFTEAMNANTFSTLSFAVEGKTVTAQSLATNVLTLTLDPADTALTAGHTARVSYQQNVSDLLGNLLNLEIGEVIEVTVQ